MVAFEIVAFEHHPNLGLFKQSDLLSCRFFKSVCLCFGQIAEIEGTGANR